jgi:hypothetical protein
VGRRLQRRAAAPSSRSPAAGDSAAAIRTHPSRSAVVRPGVGLPRADLSKALTSISRGGLMMSTGSPVLRVSRGSRAAAFSSWSTYWMAKSSISWLDTALLWSGQIMLAQAPVWSCPEAARSAQRGHVSQWNGRAVAVIHRGRWCGGFDPARPRTWPSVDASGAGGSARCDDDGVVRHVGPGDLEVVAFWVA